MLGDGMADYPVPELGAKPRWKPPKSQHGFSCPTWRCGYGENRTGRHAARVGYRKSVGYGVRPKIYYSGRSPLEAVSIGIPLEADDVTFRCNLVTLSDGGSFEDETMLDFPPMKSQQRSPRN
jgi:2,3-bisphosphoglycerate-independent phosphoglycerate mutase